MPIFMQAPPQEPHAAMGSFSRQPLLNGIAGTAQTIKLMRRLIDDALRDPSIVRLATEIIRHVPAFDDLSETHAIYDWVKRNFRFTKDPVNKEKLYPPAELLKIRAGDCDDISMILGTLLMAAGYPARLITVSANSNAPDQFSHVYVEGQVMGQWIPMDAARPDAQFGVEPPFYFRKRAWSLQDDTYTDLGRLGSYGRVSLGDAQQTSSMIASVTGGTADIIRAAKGQPASPWDSFQTQYSPFSTAAGYAIGQGAANLLPSSGSTFLWIGLAVGAFFLMKGRS